MKREILFKGKRVENGEWVEGKSLIQGEIEGREFTQIEHSDFDNYRQYEVLPETVCQFTGLLDKNGNKIFEGDEIKTPYGMGKVSFYHACFMIEWIDDVEASMELVGLDSNFKSKRTDLEVIGNIHD